MKKVNEPVYEPGDSSLPKHRWALLKDTLHYHFFDLVGLSLLALVFCLPLAAYVIYISVSGLLDMGNLYSILLSYSLLIVFLLFASLGQAGLFYTIKRLAWGEGTAIASDFFLGIKKNWKMFLAIYFAFGLLYLILKLDLGVLTAATNLPDYAKTIIAGLSYGVFFLFAMVLSFCKTQTVLYESGFFKLVANAFRFLFGAILPNLAIFIAVYVPFFVYELVPNLYAGVAVLAFEGLFYFGFSAFFLTVYCHSIYDKTINARQFPEIIRRGLAPLPDKEKEP